MRSVRNIKLLNLNCREASRLVSEGMDRDLSFMERLGLRLHLMICSACRTWRRQVLVIRRAMVGTLRTTDDGIDTVEATLTPEARDRMRRAIESRS